MSKKINFSDGTSTVSVTDVSSVEISDITQGFNLDVSGLDGVVVEYEIYLVNGGPLMRPRRPR